jgi:hypothetical protein
MLDVTDQHVVSDLVSRMAIHHEAVTITEDFSSFTLEELNEFTRDSIYFISLYVHDE